MLKTGSAGSTGSSRRTKLVQGHHQIRQYPLNQVYGAVDGTNYISYQHYLDTDTMQKDGTDKLGYAGNYGSSPLMMKIMSIQVKHILVDIQANMLI